jgi:hypothetical protein
MSGGTGGTGAAGTAGGMAGVAGSANRGGEGGDAVSGAPGVGGSSGGVPDCIDAEASLGRIPTVGVVTFSVSGMSDISSAWIDFGPDMGATMTAPVDLNRTNYRTLLLGMKGSTTYRYRITATGRSGTCTSSEYSLTTGPVPPEIVSPLVVNVTDPEAHDRGFIITSVGFNTVILDADGDPVWWVPSGDPLRAHMSWDGNEMVILTGAGDQPGAGLLRAYAMDGTPLDGSLDDTMNVHHDFTAVPEGIAMLVGAANGESLVERASDGTTNVVAELASLYNAEDDNFHSNAVHYYPWDDSYTVSDRHGALFVKITRDGELVWQLGGLDPKDPAKHFSTDVTWTVNHGHHLLRDGTFVFFDNGDPQAERKQSMLRALTLDPMSMTASSFVAHPVGFTGTFGDAQRTANGNYLVTDWERISEITPSGDVVVTIEGAGSTYSEYRPTLYGPPGY